MSRHRCTTGILVAICLLWTTGGRAGDERPAQGKPVWACDQPFMFGFGSWEKAWKEPQVGKDGIRIVAASAQGGAGIGVLHRSLEGCGDFTPAINLATR